MLEIEWLGVFSLLKIVRALKLKSFIKKLNTFLKVKLILRLFFLIVCFPLAYHAMGCIWGFFMLEWEPPNFWLDPTLQFTYTNSKYYQYLLSLYYSLLSGVGKGDIGPVTIPQLVLGDCFMVIGAILNTYAFALMAVLVSAIGKEEREVQDKINQSNDIMHNLNLPKLLRKQVRRYIILSEKTKA